MAAEPYKYLFNYLKTAYTDVRYLSDKTFVDISDKRKNKTYETISFYVNSNKEEISNRFTNSKPFDNYIEIDWGLKPYKIYYDEEAINNECCATCLMPYTDKVGYVDTSYHPFNQEISCIGDINKHLIRLKGNNYNMLLQTNPEYIIKLLKLKSTTNFTIEPYTLIAMEQNKQYIKDFTLFYNILSNPYVLETLEFVNYINFFKDTTFEKEFNKIYGFKNVITKAKDYKLSFMEIYFIIFRNNLYNNHIYNTLSNYDKYCVQWCDKNYNILTEDKAVLRQNIYNSMDKIIVTQGMQLLKNCLIRLNNIHILQKDKQSISKDILAYCLCGRPYFKEQLHITDEEIIEIFQTRDIDDIKDKIIRYILTLEYYPYSLVKEVKDHYKEILNF